MKTRIIYTILFTILLSCAAYQRQPTELEKFITEYESIQSGKQIKVITKKEEEEFYPQEEESNKIKRTTPKPLTKIEDLTLEYIINRFGLPVFKRERPNEIVLIYQEYLPYKISIGHRVIFIVDPKTNIVTKVFIKKWNYSDIFQETSY